LLGAIASCDPGWSGVGHLIDAKGAPVDGASVKLVCPSGSSGRSEISDATGSFTFGGVGSSFESPKCSVEIEKPGFTKQTVRTLDLCYRSTNAKNFGKPCATGEGNITLAIDPTYVAPITDAGAAAPAPH
jgi:hypothetical protein